LKISCQSCQAKYTIADEKVLGKIVKIRCKKCGATIVINGNEQEAATAAFDASAAQQPGNAVYDYTAQGGGESWTVNVSDGDQRTMTTAEIAAAYSQSVVNDETYCWKDGMGDWLPLREIPELHGAANAGPQPSMHADSYSQPPPPPQEDQPTQAGFSSLFGGGGGGGGADAGASLFGGGAAAAAAAPAAAASAPAARRAGGRAAGGADLFGSAATAGSEQDVMSSAAAQGSAGGSMTGQRNENSVLFSLSALTANAPKEDAPMPQGDGSGLIDIRALSAGMASTNNGPNKADDIMNLGGGGAFSAALAAPVLAPAPADMSDLNVGAGGERKKGNAGLIIGMIAGLAIFGLLVGGGIIYALKAPPAVPTAATATATAPTDTATATTTATTTAPTATVAATDTATAKPPGVGTTTGTVKTPTGGTNTGGGTAATAVVPTATATSTPTGKCGCAPSDFECAMKCSAGQSTAPTATATAAAGGGAAFDRGAAASTLGSIASSLGSCKKPDGPTGPGKVKVTFQPSGTVSAVEFVEGSYAGTSVGGCILAKFRGAHIPPFGGSAVPANKSFVLN
jgi:predicted Zn finger-like uncharacterized protein